MTLYKYCKRCGKRLKGEENRLRGYGKTCFQRVRREQEDKIRVLVPIDTLPIEIISEPKDEKGKIQQGKVKSKGLSEPRKTQGSEPSRVQIFQANFQSKGQSKKIFHKQEQSKGGRPPHLEKTLTPTYKKPLLFRPHTATPTPY